jgi:lipoprotein signal peptidase
VREVQAAGGTSLTGNKVVVTESGRADGSAARGRQEPRPRVVLLLAIAVAVLATDIVTKVIVVATLTNRPYVHVIGNFLMLTETRNPGAAFSIGGPSTTVLFSAIAVGVVIFIVRTSRRIRSVGWAITLGLLLGGATGNLVDRIFRYPGPFRGWVVDWIVLPHWPVFNVADSCIVCGGVLAVLMAMLNIRIDGSRGLPARRPGQGAGAEADQHGDGERGQRDGDGA